MRLVHLTVQHVLRRPRAADARPGRGHAANTSRPRSRLPRGRRCAAFLDEVRGRGFDAVAAHQRLPPHVRPAVRELTAFLRDTACDVLLCHGYKANILGRAGGAARRDSRRRGVARLDRRDAQGAALRVARPPAPAVHGPRRLRLRRAGGEGAPVVPRAASRGSRVIRNSARLAAFETPIRTRATGCSASSRVTAGCHRSCSRPGGSAPRRGSACWSRRPRPICREQPDGRRRAVRRGRVAARTGTPRSRELGLDGPRS